MTRPPSAKLREPRKVMRWPALSSVSSLRNLLLAFPKSSTNVPSYEARCCSCCCCSACNSLCCAPHCTSASLRALPTRARASRRASAVVGEPRGLGARRPSQAPTRASRMRTRSSNWAPTSLICFSMSCFSASHRCCSPAKRTETRSASCPTFMSPTGGIAEAAPHPVPGIGEACHVGFEDPGPLPMSSIFRCWLMTWWAKSSGFMRVSEGHGS
mmetsp:Transcript_23444/g.67595  ORF Transcript_23444/g.67595 Transcript_23444/m.67595 type:complete len:214 (+) Transcript_23444:1376-2017(+)